VYEHIRQVMRGALENLAVELGRTSIQRDSLLLEFDQHRRIVEILRVDPGNARQPVRRMAPDPEPDVP
jgi:hypothetical protein